MKQKYIKVYNHLKKIGVPVYEHIDDNGNFSIDAEGVDSWEWVEYYSDNPEWNFGINPKIESVLDKYGMFAEWMNPGRLCVYEV